MNNQYLTIQDNSIARIEAINKTAADNYIDQAAAFIKWLRANNQEVTEDSIRLYFTWLNDESGYRARSIALKRQAVKKRVRQLFKDAPIDDRIKIDRVLTELDHETKTKAPKINTQQVTRDMVLSLDEYNSLLNVCRSEKQKLFIEFLFTTGCRVSEMLNIRLVDIDDLGTTAKIKVMGKGKKERAVKISERLLQRIKREFKGSVYLFETSRATTYTRCYVSDQIRKIGKRINRNISAHTLRHSWATRMVNQYPGKIDAISKYLGHSTPSITIELYCHNELTDEELFIDFVA